MSTLPVVSGERLLKSLQKIGYYVRDQKGSHIHLRHPTRNPLTIPNHKEIARGTLRQIIRDADLTLAEFRKLL
jgi:predicted RNA binding protein YcfA (HicA-like mRNA interferase family)